MQVANNSKSDFCNSFQVAKNHMLPFAELDRNKKIPS